MAGAQQLSAAELLARAADGVRERLLDDVVDEAMLASLQRAVLVAERRRGWQDLLVRLGSSSMRAPDRSDRDAMAELQRAPTTMAPEEWARAQELIARYVRRLAYLLVAAHHPRGTADRLPWMMADGEWDGDLVTVVYLALDPSSAVKREAT